MSQLLLKLQVDFGNYSGVKDLNIDLACLCGWTDSPWHHWTAGGAIVYLYVNSSPIWEGQQPADSENVDGKAWCDDHVCIEPDV